MDKKTINTKRLNEFCSLLEESSISEKGKKSIKFAMEFLEDKHSLKLSTRSFIFYGEPGVGKTYLVESMLKAFNIPIIVAGCAELNHKNAIKCENLEAVIKEIRKYGRFIVFLDDLGYIFKFADYICEVSADSQQQFMKITELIKNSDKRAILLITSNNINYLDESIIDRIETKINVDIPSEDNKLKFLKRNFADVADLRQLEYLARYSIGYNYRDLPEVIKMAYRDGNGIISIENVRNAVKDYVPTSLLKLKIIPFSNMNFGNVVGREKVKNILKNVIYGHENKKSIENLGLKRHNLLIFEGNSGTGKTFMVGALAGEMKFPIINYNAHYFARRGIANAIEEIKVISKRFKNCIIFIDEADKILGRGSLDEDDFMGGHLNEIFDGLDGIIESLVIVAVNNIGRFGTGLKDRFTTIKFDMPDYHERLEFLRKKLEAARRIVKQNIDMEDLARTTSEMSFRDLDKMWNNAIYGCIEKKGILTAGIFTDIVNSMRGYEDYGQIYG